MSRGNLLCGIGVAVGLLLTGVPLALGQSTPQPAQDGLLKNGPPVWDANRDGVFTCDDPNATAWRMAALLDGLSVQATVHEGIISRTELLAWVRTAASTELGLASGAFTEAARDRRTHVA